MKIEYLHITFHSLISSRKIDHLMCCVVQIINIIVSLKQNEGFNQSIQENIVSTDLWICKLSS